MRTIKFTIWKKNQSAWFRHDLQFCCRVAFWWASKCFTYINVCAYLWWEIHFGSESSEFKWGKIHHKHVIWLVHVRRSKRPFALNEVNRKSSRTSKSKGSFFQSSFYSLHSFIWVVYLLYGPNQNIHALWWSKEKIYV